MQSQNLQINFSDHLNYVSQQRNATFRHLSLVEILYPPQGAGTPFFFFFGFAFVSAAHMVPLAGWNSAPVSHSSVANAFYWALRMTLCAI